MHPDEDSLWRSYDAAWQMLPRDEVASRRLFAAAHDAFAAAARPDGAGACAAAALIAIASRHADYRGVGLWLQRFDLALPTDDANALVRLRGQAAWLCRPSLDPGIDFRDPRVRSSADALYAALRDDLAMPADERILHAKLLIDHLSLDNDAERFRHVAALLRTSAEAADASPYWVGVWWYRLASALHQFGDLEAAAASRERARAIGETHRIADIEFAMAAEDLTELLVRGDLAGAARKAQRMNALAPSVNAVWQGNGLATEARLYLVREEPALARTLCERALRLYEDTELSDRERDMTRAVLAQAHVLLGEEDDAITLFERMRVNQSGGQLSMLEANILATRAAQALRRGEPDARDKLSRALAQARAIDWYALFFTLPKIAARLFAAALAHDIERDFVVKAIRGRRLAAPDPADERWPWPIRIRALGNFVVERDGEPIAIERKAQKKPLELLKALVAAGGEAVPREALAHALWPDPDADALVSFDTTLSRLRKLLDIEGALVLADGKLSLAPRIVWSDVAAFDARCTRLIAAVAADADAAQVDPLAAAAFALYRDKLFGDEPAARWSAAARERLALRFDRAVSDVGAWLERRGEWRAAIDRYERGVAQSMLAEPFYRGLMRCHGALGESTEALRAFRRCRDLLSMVLGVSPSDETERLHQQIRAA